MMIGRPPDGPITFWNDIYDSGLLQADYDNVFHS